LGPTLSTERKVISGSTAQRRLDREDHLGRDRLLALLRLDADLRHVLVGGEGRIEDLAHRDVAQIERLQRARDRRPHRRGCDDSVRIVVPPRKSMPKFSPTPSQTTTDRIIATTDAPKVGAGT
jgi:hypothetical protein